MTALSREALEARLAALEAENATLKASPKRAVSLKVSQKGAVSLYGLGRFPVTLYGSQWKTLLESAPKIEEFLKVNASVLASKE